MLLYLFYLDIILFNYVIYTVYTAYMYYIYCRLPATAEVPRTSLQTVEGEALPALQEHQGLRWTALRHLRAGPMSCLQ